jgi:hypothetical protein
MDPAVATAGNQSQMRPPRNRELRPKPLPWVATGCRRDAMVRVVPLRAMQGVTLLAPQEVPSPANPKATGLDCVTLTGARARVNPAREEELEALT